MPARFEKDTRGAAHFMHECEVCGSWGSFGVGVYLRKAMTEGNARKAGKWFCREHWKGTEDDTLDAGDSRKNPRHAPQGRNLEGDQGSVPDQLPFGTLFD